MNDARLTMRLPGEYLLFARDYAKKRDMTLTDLVVGYFKRLKESLSEVDQLPGSVRDMLRNERDGVCVFGCKHPSAERAFYEDGDGQKTAMD